MHCVPNNVINLLFLTNVILIPRNTYISISITLEAADFFTFKFNLLFLVFLSVFSSSSFFGSHFSYLIKICRRWHKSILFELMFFLYTRMRCVCLWAPIKQNTDKIVIKTITIVWIYGFDGFIVPLFLSKNAVTNRPDQVWSIQMIRSVRVCLCALWNQPLHHSNRHDWLEN